MTCGIYLLGYACTDKVYVGQSIDIESRFYIHKYKMLKQIHAPKLNKAYREYGYPTLEILEICDRTELNDKEIYHIKLWNALDGFNTSNIMGVKVQMFGETNPHSSCSNKQVLDAAILLCDPSNSFEKIAISTGISKQVVNHIASGEAHTWIKDEYPEVYNTIISLRGSRVTGRKSAKDQGITYPNIISPEGVIYNVEHTRQFAKLHNIDPGNLGKLLRKKVNTVKGWKRVEPNV